MATIDKRYNYQIWDDTEAVTVSLKRHAGTTAVTVSVALRGPLTKRDTAILDALGETAECSWNVPVILLDPSATGRKINKGDTILDADGVTWVANYADLVEDRTCWRCLCVPQR